MSDTEVKLYKCEPVDWKWLPRTARLWLGWFTIEYFVLSFLSIPITFLLIFPVVWKYAYGFCVIFTTLVFASMVWPTVEWPYIRKFGQLWYEIFQVHCNLSPEELQKRLLSADDAQFIMAMHPHGIVPLQAVLWAAYCDQYFSDPASGRALYGFGAAADVVGWLPFLRNIMGWLSAGPADYKSLYLGLKHAIAPTVNAAGRKPRHLFILPGGVAEIFVSTPGKHAIVFKSRKGLCKLSIETGARLTPCYVFGGTDFFHNLATGDGWLSHLSRAMKAGITVFWGKYGLPIPFTPKVTLVIGEPIVAPEWDGKGKVPVEIIDDLHEQFMKAMVDLFEKHKAVCGYPDAQLEIL